MDIDDKKDICSTCQFKSKTKEATNWCVDCKEPLCVSCFENHDAHISSKDHHIILLEGIQLLESIYTS